MTALSILLKLRNPTIIPTTNQEFMVGHSLHMMHVSVYVHLDIKCTCASMLPSFFEFLLLRIIVASNFRLHVTE